MYKEFYLMQKEPFDSHPSPELFYKSNVHQTAWHYLVQGIKQHEPILVLAGEYGAGKTLLFLKLVRLMQTKGRVPVIPVPSPTYNFAMILEKIVEKLLNISAGSIDENDESKLQQAVYEYFENTETKDPIFIIIDDAQEFSYSFINKLRLFASYNCSGFFPIRIIFFAHHSFLKMLTYKKLVALGQRIKRIYHLSPLNYEETREYIYFRLIHSGATGAPVFDDEAIRVVQAVSKGNPRLINNVCDNCLLLAGDERINLIDAGVVRKAVEIGRLPGVGSIDMSDSFTPRNQPPMARDIQAGPNGNHRTNHPAGPVSGRFPDSAPLAFPRQGPVPTFEAPPAYPPPQGPGGNYPGTYPPAFSQPPHFTDMRQGPEPVPRDEVKRHRSVAKENLLSRYWKIAVILLLMLIAMTLASYLFGSASVLDLSGTSRQKSGRIVQKISPQSFTILKSIPTQQGGDSFGSRKPVVWEYAREGKEERQRRYQPVLLTERSGS